jgi:hypothetical protein
MHASQRDGRRRCDVGIAVLALTVTRRPRAGSFLFFVLYATRWTMADVTESAESRQLLDSLKGRMYVLKEHL